MRAVVFEDVELVAFTEVDEPRLTAPRDAIVEVEFAGLCGSDLHPYFGREVGIEAGTVMGHEFLGRVVALGDEVAPATLALGDRVVAPFTTSCGRCTLCLDGLTARCPQGELFGWREGGRGLHGGQAERVRVPLADATLVRVPDALEDGALALLAGDILSTAIFGNELAGVGAGSEVAVVGCGPVGLLAAHVARRRGAARVFAADPVESRRREAARLGAVALDPSEAASAIREQTDGLGVGHVIEAAGGEAATRLAGTLARPGARIGAVAVHTEPALALSPTEIYDRNLSYASGRCPARRFLPEALEIARDDAALLAPMISHRLPLSDGPEAYRRFGAREPGWTKVVFTL